MLRPLHRNSISQTAQLTNQTDTVVIDNSFTYYHIAFNLSEGNEFTQTELVDRGDLKEYELIPINDSTLHCLKPGVVVNPYPLVHVSGCSTLNRPKDLSCTYQAPITRNATALDFGYNTAVDPRRMGIYKVGNAYRYDVFIFRENDGIVEIFPEYLGEGRNTTLVCMRQAYFAHKYRETASISFHLWCILTSRWNASTLFERWTYNPRRQTMHRLFAGPVFDVDVSVGQFAIVNFVVSAQVDMNWVVLSGVIMAEALVYVFRKTDVVFTAKISHTLIPNNAVAIFILMTVSITIIRIISFFAIEQTETRPQLNAIDGLSSIAREEHMPTGKSLVRGRPMLIGFRQTVK